MFETHFAITPSELQAFAENSKRCDQVELTMTPSREGGKGVWLNAIFYNEEGQAETAMTFKEVF